MFKNQVIKKMVASAMLIVFAFSIMPTIVFHNWLVNHTDSFKKDKNSKGDQLGKQTFNCHCDNMVAESPFTETETCTGLAPIQIFAVAKTVATVQLPSSPIIFNALRGPPVV